MTPAGPVSKLRAHFVPEGARVEHSEEAIHIISSGGSIIHTAPTAKNTRRDSAEIFSRAYTDGYAAYSYWGPNPNTSVIANFSTSWIVPDVPAKADGQLLYVFNALVPTSLDTILQPVLQFGVSSAGGGSYWAVGSWYVNGPEVYYSTLYPVSPGQAISGVMTLQGNKTSSTGKVQYSYNSVFSGIASTSMTINSNELLTYAYEALEIYTTSGATDLPTGKTTLKSINIVDQNGQHPTVNWTPVSNTAEGFGVTVVTNGANNGEIDLVYPSSSASGGSATTVAPASTTATHTTTVNTPSTTISTPSSTIITPSSSPTSVGAVSLYGQCGGVSCLFNNLESTC